MRTGVAPMAVKASFDHVHILTDDVDHMVATYKATFGAVELRRLPRGENSYMVHLALGSARIVVSPSEEPGTRVDHIALTTPDLQGAADGIVASGGEIVRPKNDAGPYRTVFVRDAQGMVIELVDPPTA